MMQLDGTTAAMVESIKFARYPGSCEFGEHHDRYEITWTDQLGATHVEQVYWCDHPLCETGATRWRLFTSPPEVKLTTWLRGAPNVWDAVAVAYLLLVFPLDALPRMEARVGICAQWRDPQYGNLEEPGEEFKLFTERYFAESGPGIYPATIETRSDLGPCSCVCTGCQSNNHCDTASCATLP